MLLYDLFFGGFSFLWIAGIAVVLIFYFLNKDAPANTTAPPNDKGREDDTRDLEWRRYIASFKEQYKKPGEQQLIEEMLSGEHAPDAAAGPAYDAAPSRALAYAEASPSSTASMQPTEWSASKNSTQPEPIPAARQELDNTLLLLYFGAFLFVAAAGLFVAFAGFSGGVRTFLVLVTALVMYGGGLWLAEQKERIRPAGVTFVAIGMAIAPLVGVTAYHYMTQQHYGPFIWLVTSILCLGLYSVALVRLRTTFIAYFFIFSFISLFESAVSILAGSTQYYVWMLIIIGMLLRVFGFIRESAELEKPAAISAQIMIPLGLIVSLAMIGSHGIGQLSISLLLAAIYYTIEAYQNREGRENLAVAAHALYLTGVTLAVYTLFDSATAVAICLLIITLLHTILLDMLPADNPLARNVASIAFAAAIPAAFLAYPNGGLMAVSVAVAGLLGFIIAMHQHRVDAFAGSALALIALPFVIGQFALTPNLGATWQTIAAFIPVLILWRAWAWMVSKDYNSEWISAASILYVLAGIAALLPAISGSGWLTIGASLALALTMAVAARSGAGKDWWAGAGTVAALPVAVQLDQMHEPTFTVAVLAALGANIVITLLSRNEFNRWLLTALGLLIPVALGAGGLGTHWSAAAYAYAYLAIMAGAIICRGLARGEYLPSSHVPVSSMYRQASLSYVVGYLSAATLSLFISLAAPASRLHTSIILLVFIIANTYLAVTIEKNKKFLAFLPWLATALLVSIFRPGVDTATANLVLLTASALAAFCYFIAGQAQQYLQQDFKEVHDATLAMSYLPVLLALFYNQSAIIPAISLAIAGCLTLYHAWEKRQSDREVAGGVIVLAIMWALFAYDVHNIQAYTHILAATFALYAYWRSKLWDPEARDTYLYAMLGTATIPLILQALGGEAGDAYGWWLLLEQVGFMVLGIVIGRKFVTLWGLYVAIGAVLYQLRHLGWAALSFLALFIIGIAVYRLLKSSDRPDNPEQK